MKNDKIYDIMSGLRTELLDNLDRHDKQQRVNPNGLASLLHKDTAHQYKARDEIIRSLGIDTTKQIVDSINSGMERDAILFLVQKFGHGAKYLYIINYNSPGDFEFLTYQSLIDSMDRYLNQKVS